MLFTAIFHCPIQIIQRSKGKSAVAAAAYRSGEKLVNEWDGMTHDYTKKSSVVHTEIMLPAHAPPAFADHSTLRCVPPHHHERRAGSGYPNRLAEDSITPWVQVVGLTDVFDALVHPRVYKPAFTQQQAEEMIGAGVCGIFTPLFLACFARHIGAIGRSVYVSTG